jgi:hypothetical protein
MRWIVFCERPDPWIWNDDSTQRGTLRGRKRRQNSGAHRNWALRRARRHRAVRAAGLAITPIGERLAATRVGNRITHARAQDCRIRERGPLKNSSQNQGNGEQATVHGAESVPQSPSGRQNAALRRQRSCARTQTARAAYASRPVFDGIHNGARINMPVQIARHRRL